MGTELRPQIRFQCTVWTLAITGMAILSGCQRGMYHPSALPAELIASPTVDVRTLDLSRLASPTANSQKIGPGDILHVTVVTGAEDRQPDAWPMRVNEDGTVQVPLVGSIQLAGLDLQSAQNVVRQTSINRGIFKNPSVSIGVEKRQTNRVTVLGAVDEPGSFDLDASSSDLLAAISAAGGLTPEASQMVEIRQPPQRAWNGSPAYPSTPELDAIPGFDSPTPAGEPTPAVPPSDGDVASVYQGMQRVSHDEHAAVETESFSIDLIAATSTPTPRSYPLKDGAVVMIRPQKPRYIRVLGLVNRPDQFEIQPSQNVRVLDALAMAGGRTVSAADRVFVIRQSPFGQEPALIETSVTQAKENPAENLLLADGDVVSVEETPTTFVLGIFRQFIRIGVNGTASVF